MGGGSISYNERALSELELILKFPELGLIPHPPLSTFFRFPGNGIPSTVRCDARIPSSTLRPSACGFRFAKRTITPHNHSDGIDPMSWMKIMLGPSQQRGGNSACATHRPDTHTQSCIVEAIPLTLMRNCGGRNALISPENVTSSYLKLEFGATTGKCLIRHRDGRASRNATPVIEGRGVD
ncbi:hypothetical protein BJV78DRAFT_190702 [Lactifluus subvellereus]|nr:hypothetical protein BJV78DRAFT_190702 [Lactifluus subvellereus]